jgi:hypothetical protein
MMPHWVGEQSDSYSPLCAGILYFGIACPEIPEPSHFSGRCRFRVTVVAHRNRKRETPVTATCTT